MTSYALTAKINGNGTTETISGALSTFPSGLIYSVKFSAPIPSLSGLGALQGLSGQGLVIPGLNMSGGLGSLEGGFPRCSWLPHPRER